jgi:hypothetical protein
MRIKRSGGGRPSIFDDLARKGLGVSLGPESARSPSIFAATAPWIPIREKGDIPSIELFEDFHRVTLTSRPCMSIDQGS